MSFMDELKKLTKPYDDDDEYYGDDDYDEGGEEEAPAHTRRSPAVVDDNTPAYGSSSDSYSPVASSSGSRVVNINASTQLQVVLVRPDSFDSVGQIADHLRERRAVLLNLEQTEKNVARRLVDFLSGCAYALDGKIKKVATSTYLVTPFGVDIMGDVMEELENNGMYF